jgi:hypothetical protein
MRFALSQRVSSTFDPASAVPLLDGYDADSSNRARNGILEMLAKSSSERLA